MSEQETEHRDLLSFMPCKCGQTIILLPGGNRATCTTHVCPISRRTGVCRVENLAPHTSEMPNLPKRKSRTCGRMHGPSDQYI